jgi:uncharacterized membrane protein YozB (DUF420 family)
VNEAGRQRSRSRWRIASLVIGCAALLLPLWIVRYPPLLDYPNHVASSFVLAHLHDPGVHFSEQYRADWSFSPFLATDVFLVGLQRLVPVERAGRVLLSICVLALPLSVWFFAQQTRAQHEVAVLWAFVLTYNLFFLVGFVQYCLGIAGCFAVLGLWWRYLDRPSVQRWVGLLVAVMTLYSVHLFGFAMAAVAAGVYALAKRLPFGRLCLSWIVFVPGVLLVLSARAGTPAAHTIVYGSLIRKAEWLPALLAVHPNPAEPANLVVFALFALAVALPLWRNRDLRWNRAWGLAAATLFALYLALPGGYVFRGNFLIVDSRILPFAFVLVAAAVDVGRRGRWFTTVAVLIFAVRMVTLTGYFLAEQPRLDRLARAIDVVPANVRLLPIWRSEPGRFNVQLFRPNHFWGYGVMRRNWVSPYLFSSGVHALHPAHGEPYPPAGDLAFPQEEELDWERLRNAYDYVWAYRLPRLSNRFGAIGELVFADEGLEVYRMRSNSARGPAAAASTTRHMRPHCAIASSAGRQ